MSSTLTIINKTRSKLPNANFDAIAKAVLGSRYSLNLLVVGPAEIKKLNYIYRNKEEVTDILSFPFSKTEGEIYICLSEARKEARNFDRSYENFILFLFIHGCVHLKGHDHSGTMERIEARVRRKFGI